MGVGQPKITLLFKVQKDAPGDNNRGKKDSMILTKCHHHIKFTYYGIIMPFGDDIGDFWT